MTRARFVVRGVVQGVNFRAATAREASTRGLTGRVWNTADGAVGVIAEGEAGAVAELEAWLGHGPRMAEVDGVERADLEGAPRYRDFRIAYDAPE
ncbi:MAG TPA: acylphosphatase [Candidatus Limnocylindria bacterium]|nr:acylphosphatase [Candidatus Limnocylindria bacterium]